MIIDCHGHYTTAPKQHEAWRKQQLEALSSGQSVPPRPTITDAEIVESIVGAQLKTQQDRGTDLTIFSPRAAGMGHHEGDAAGNEAWAIACNDLIYRVTELFPRNFAGVCMLPQVPGVEPGNCMAELRRAVTELGFLGCNLNPDPSGGHWTDPPLSDRYWYPLYEELCALDVPAMIHVSMSCNPAFHTTGAHYLNGDTSAFMQLLDSDVFADFPDLRVIIPHGGGAVPYHWGRFEGLAQKLQRSKMKELMRNVYFDTCVYHLPGQELLAKVVPIDRILFGSEMIGAVPGVNPETGHNFDDTKRYVDALDLSSDDKARIYYKNAMEAYPALKARLSAMAA